MTPPLVLIAASARLTRLITTDDLGQWWVQDPIDRAASRWYDQQVAHAEMRGEIDPVIEQPWWWKYRSGLDCNWCTGFWAALLVVGLTSLTRGTPLSRPWRGLMGALALNYVAAHVESLLTAADDQETDR